MKPGGILYFSTNFSRFQLAAGSLAAAGIADITKSTTAFDFEEKLKRWCYRIIK
jgi:23S rRNA (cytosine1962-C5)-methyltransferase